MVIHQLDIDGVLSVELEDQPPVARDSYGPLSFAVALRRMEAIIREIHAPWLAAVIKGGKHAPKLGDELRVQTACVVPHEKPLQAARRARQVNGGAAFWRQKEAVRICR